MSGEQSLTALKAGITRLREKGGARPDTLWDLQNGYVNSAGIAQIRPGSVIDSVLPEGTFGLIAHQNQMHVFAAAPVTMTDPDYVCDVLRHPSDPSADLVTIEHAESFMQVLYVVATWDDENTYHYWLRSFDSWEALTSYAAGQMAQPTVPNGYLYRAERIGDAGEVWAAGDGPRVVNDYVEPTTYNGFRYKAVAVYGPNPASGTVEPIWPTVDGGQVIETSDIEPQATTVPTVPGQPPETDGGGGIGTEPYGESGPRLR